MNPIRPPERRPALLAAGPAALAWFQIKQGRRDSNPQPAALETAALPN